MRAAAFTLRTCAVVTAFFLAACGGGSGVGPPANQSAPNGTAGAMSAAQLPSTVNASFTEFYPQRFTETRTLSLSAEETAESWQQGALTAPATGSEDGRIAHVYPWPIQRPVPEAGVKLVLYHGGPIEKSPKFVLVLWGFGNCTSSGCTNDPDGTEGFLFNFLHSVGGAHYLKSTTQYFSSAQGHITNPAGNLIAFLADNNPAPRHPSQGQVAQQAGLAEAFLKQHHVVTGLNKDINYVIALGFHHDPTGFRPGGFCAFHSAFGTLASFQPYTDFPYVTEAGAGCGAFTVDGALDGVSIVLGHEVGETITDPALNAWFDANGEEIGDKCANLGLNQNVLLRNGIVLPVQPLWSNAIKGCAV